MKKKREEKKEGSQRALKQGGPRADAAKGEKAQTNACLRPDPPVIRKKKGQKPKSRGQ